MNMTSENSTMDPWYSGRVPGGMLLASSILSIAWLIIISLRFLSGDIELSMWHVTASCLATFSSYGLVKNLGISRH